LVADPVQLFGERVALRKKNKPNTVIPTPQKNLYHPKTPAQIKPLPKRKTKTTTTKKQKTYLKNKRKELGMVFCKIFAKKDKGDNRITV